MVCRALAFAFLNAMSKRGIPRLRRKRLWARFLSAIACLQSSVHQGQLYFEYPVFFRIAAVAAWIITSVIALQLSMPSCS